MSNADTEQIVTADSDGVSVEKSFEPDDFPVPAIAFALRSERDETVSIRLVDTVPSHVPPEDIGFHPKYGAEHWDVEGDTIVFERDLEPDEEYTTVYGLRGGDSEDVEQFMSEPEFERIDPPLADDDAGQTVREVIGDDRDADEVADAVEAVDATADASAADDANSTDVDDDATAGAAAGAGDAATEETSIDLSETDDEATSKPAAPGDASVAQVDADSLVVALADEIRAGDVDDEAVADLRDALGVETASGSVDARIERLQSEVADLEAYVDALEEFLDENGDAQQLIEDVRADYEETAERIDEIEATAESAAETAESVDDRLDEQFEDLEARVDEELEDVDSEVESIVDERLDEELEELWAAVDDAETEAAEVSSELRAFREQVDSGADEERIDELEAEVEALSEELEDVAEMRDRLASALGGLADAQDGDGSDDE